LRALDFLDPKLRTELRAAVSRVVLRYYPFYGPADHDWDTMLVDDITKEIITLYERQCFENMMKGDGDD
jgi:hypothetical protein